MKNTDFDLFVVGGGSGGVRAARTAAQRGVRVALCESSAMGGTCVNLGCVPKKLFSYASAYAADFVDAQPYGWTVDTPTFDWPTLVSNKDIEIQRLNNIYVKMLEKAGVTVIIGHGQLEDAHTVRVGEKCYRSARILIATGSKPWLPDIPGIEHALSSDQLFHLTQLPKRLAVVGGGYIGVEFASIFHGLGVDVDLIHRGERILKGFDAESVLHLQNELIKRGIRLHLNCAVHSISESMEVAHSQGLVQTDAVLVATGRHPNTSHLGLDRANIKTSNRGAILVDDTFASSAPTVYALGDVIDRVQLTPTALEEATRLTHYLFGGGPTPSISFEGPPTAIFSKPEFATVGLTEINAKEKYEVDVYTSNFRPMKHTVGGRDERNFMKLVVDQQSQRVLGCHMVGQGAGEIMQGLAIAIECGATKSQFDATLGIHPTSAEEFVTMRTARKN